MRVLRITLGILRGAISIFKKLLAILILWFATYINTDIGKWTLLSVLAGVIYGAYHFEHIALFPVGVRVASAGVRRGILFTMTLLLTPRIRFKIYRVIDQIKRISKRKWGAFTPLKKFVIKCAVVVVVGSILLDHFHDTHILAGAISVFPIPVFITVYATEKIPALIIGFAERQGVGKLVYEGGWHLLPSQLRKPLDAAIYIAECKIVASRQRAMERASKKLRQRAQKKQLKKLNNENTASD